MQIYSDIEVLQSLKFKIPAWAYDGKCIYRDFSFNSYLDSIEFVNRVAKLAEEIDHHPLLIVSWSNVLVKLETHSVNAISSLDFELASKLDRL